MNQNNPKKNILFFLNSITFGGAEKQTIDLLNNLDRNSFNVGLVYLDPKEDLLPQIDKDNILCIECLNRSGRFDFAILDKLKKIITKNNIDTVFCINEYTFLYAFLCKKRFLFDFKLVTAIHHTIARPGIWEFVKNELYCRLLNKCDVVLFVCKKQLEYWAKNYHIHRNRSTYIYNGIDTEHFTDIFSENTKKTLRKTLGFSPNDFIVGICAVLRPEKKHTDFIDAILIAKKKGVPIKGLIIGDGQERKFIKEYLHEKKLAEDIILVGFQADVRPYISICTCMVLASHAVETFSIAALESMAMNKPVIMTNIGGASEQITPGENGFLFERGDTATLADSLMSLRKNELYKKMGDLAAQKVKINFSLQVMISSYEELFSEI